MIDNQLIIFGATGDLVKAKIIPALEVLGLEPLLYGRKDIQNPRYIRGELSDIYERLSDKEITHAYVALPPTHYETVLRELAKLEPVPHIALEKPFGTSLIDAEHLIDVITELNIKDHIYLVDHYLGKSSLVDITNLDVVAKESLVDIPSITRIEVDAWETIDVDTRGAFYSQVGTIKDFVQNHIMSIIATVLMPGDCKDNASAWRTAVLHELRYKRGLLVVGQYDGFQSISGVEPGSTTETYVSATFTYNDQFPITIRAGKALNEAKSLVTITRESGEKQEINLQSSGNPYEVIIKNFLAGNFQTSLSFAEVLAAWKITEEILEDKKGTELVVYTKGADQIVL